MGPGELLQLLLDQAGVSQAELARSAGLSAKHVNFMVKGTSRISADVAVRIQHAVPTISAEGLLIAQLKKDLFEARARFLAR